MSLISKIKHHFAVKELKKAITSRRRRAIFPAYSDVKSVLILFKSDKDETNESIRNCGRLFEQDGKKVYYWGLIDKKEPVSAIRQEYRLFGLKELNEFGLPNKNLIDELRIYDYDIVIAAYLTEELALDYLLANSRSKFKASVSKKYVQLSDLMIATNSDTDELELTRQILFYIKGIQSKD